jgi:CrcB protein
MSLAVVLGVGVVGGCGALARFALDTAVARRAGREFPYGTLVVNVLGAFALGIFVGATLGKDPYELAGVGFVGAFTTFSTWAFESHRLGEDGVLSAGVVNFVVSLFLGIVAVWAGRHLGASW